MSDSIKVMVRAALASDILCQKFVQRGVYMNLTVLQTASGAAAAGALCEQHPLFTIIVAPPSSQPSSSPSGQPTSTPSTVPTSSNPIIRHTTKMTTSFIGLLSIILLIAILRFNSSMLALIVAKKDEKKGHLYNILVVLNDNEEAILENIRHEDIAFFRPTEISHGHYINNWIMNTTNEVFERRFEVQFYDQFDLLGQSGVDEDEIKSKRAVIGDKNITKEVYVHKARLQMGMIIAVKPMRTKTSRGSARSVKGSGLHNQSQISIYSKSRSGKLGERHIPRSSSMTSMSDFHSAPSSPYRQSTAPKFAASGSPRQFQTGLGGTHSHTTPGRKDVNTLELAAFYDEELSENERRAAGSNYGLKHEVYHDESDDSGEALSIELPLKSLDQAPHGAKRSGTTGEKNNIRSRGNTIVDEEVTSSYVSGQQGSSDDRSSTSHRSRNNSFREKAPFTSAIGNISQEDKGRGDSLRMASTVTSTVVSSSAKHSSL